MAILDYFRKIETLSADEIRSFIEEREPGEYTLIDVRLPAEYQSGHLPGAKLIPVDELPDRLGELDPAKPALVYCAAGVRSRAGTAILKRAGFPEVYSMEGGIRAWQGSIAEGPPEAGMTWFAAAHSSEEVIALAWLLEDGTRLFYREMMTRQDKNEAQQLFQQLAAAETHHEKALLQLYRKRTGKEAGSDLAAEVLQDLPGKKVMEGGMELDAALSWAQDKSIQQILELAMSLEVNSYDRYLALREQFGDESAREAFGLLAAEEKAHLKRLTELFEKGLG